MLLDRLLLVSVLLDRLLLLLDRLLLLLDRLLLGTGERRGEADGTGGGGLTGRGGRTEEEREAGRRLRFLMKSLSGIVTILTSLSLTRLPEDWRREMARDSVRPRTDTPLTSDSSSLNWEKV